MISVLISIFTFVLIIVALFLILVVLAQRAKSDSGMAAMGGGMMESAFGPDTSNVLSRMTIRGAVVFFVVSFLVYLGYVHVRSHPTGAREALPNIPVSTAPASAPAAGPAATQPAAPVVSVPVTQAPDAAKTTTQSSPPPKSP
ncbi:MAG TPA: preprotein translocase subunit SecG [Opitutaceae bacterium]|nr:preprotein translocase subunit SecG [Opitutaceae bacterium]